MRNNRFGQRKGRLWLEQARRDAVWVRWEPTAAVSTLADTIPWAHSIPRAARHAQGFTRLEDFARMSSNSARNAQNCANGTLIQYVGISSTSWSASLMTAET
jgi:hypothetical protein